jgi:hypothetical protein
MKKNNLFFAFATLVVGVAMFVSCQKAEIVNDEDSLLLKKARLSAQQVTDAISGVEGTVCAGTQLQICISFAQAYTGNGSTMQTNGQVQLFLGDNPSTTDVVETDYWLQIAHQNSNTGFCFDYTFASAGTYSLRYKASNAQWSSATVTVVNCGCEENFTYVANGNNSYTFTYIPAEDMTNVPVDFTFAQGSYVSGLTSEFSQNGNGQTYSALLSFEGCAPVSWTVTLAPNCSGHSPDSNAWTDFKVNNISQKRNLSNIVIPCQ